MHWSQPTSAFENHEYLAEMTPPSTVLLCQTLYQCAQMTCYLAYGLGLWMRALHVCSKVYENKSLHWLRAFEVCSWPSIYFSGGGRSGMLLWSLIRRFQHLIKWQAWKWKVFIEIDSLFMFLSVDSQSRIAKMDIIVLVDTKILSYLVSDFSVVMLLSEGLRLRKKCRTSYFAACLPCLELHKAGLWFSFIAPWSTQRGYRHYGSFPCLNCSHFCSYGIIPQCNT